MAYKSTFLVTVFALLISGVFFEARKMLVRTEGEIHRVEDSRGALKLTTSLRYQKYCDGDSEISTLVMSLRLHYTNTGERPIILYKGSDAASTIIVSATATNAFEGKNELSQSTHVQTYGGRRITQNQRLDNLFTILPKGSSFDTISQVSVAFASANQPGLPGTVKAGEHVLQIQVITWPASAELAERLGSRWKRRGYLWHEVVQSEPMPFKIEQQAKLENCR